MTPYPIVRLVGSIGFLLVSSLYRNFVNGTLASEVPGADTAGGSEKLPGSERTAVFHTPYHDVSR
jgi:hypothetical protein